MKTILLITLISCWTLIAFTQTSENKINIKKNNFGTPVRARLSSDAFGMRSLVL